MRDSQSIEFLKTGIYLIEAIYVPIKLDDVNEWSNYNALFGSDMPFKFEEGHVYNGSNRHVKSDGRDKGIYHEKISPILIVVEVKDGIPKIISSDSDTNLNFILTRNNETTNYKYRFNKIVHKQINFNEHRDSAIDFEVSEIVDNKLKLAFYKTVDYYDGWYGYDDWLQILLAQLCVYKLS